MLETRASVCPHDCHLYLQLAEPVIPPEGEARSTWQVVRALARAMGLGDSNMVEVTRRDS